MNSLASHLTKSQGQVTPAGSYFIRELSFFTGRGAVCLSGGTRNGSPNILKSLRVCHVLEFVKLCVFFRLSVNDSDWESLV